MNVQNPHTEDERSDRESRADRAHTDTPAPVPPRRPEDRVHGVWKVPALTTVAWLLLSPVAFLFAGFSVMATDSCGPDDCSTALTASLNVIDTLLSAGGFVSLLSLAACWFLTWKHRYGVWRRWAAAVALAPQLLILFLVLTLPGG